MEYIILMLKTIGIFIYMTHGSEEAIIVLKQIIRVVKIVKVLLLPEASASYQLTNTSSLGKKKTQKEVNLRLKEGYKRKGKKKREENINQPLSCVKVCFMPIKGRKARTALLHIPCSVAVTLHVGREYSCLYVPKSRVPALLPTGHEITNGD